MRRLEDDGWILDAGQAHPGQGTRNRRLVWPEQFFELLWVEDPAEASTNPLRLDRRDCPVGLGFRGYLGDTDGYWLYDALGPRIWIRDGDERAPLVFVFEADPNLRRPRPPHRHPGDLREVRVTSPEPPPLPDFHGPPITWTPGPHALELIVGDTTIAA